MADAEIFETVEASGAVKAKEKLTVEEYLNFFNSNMQLDLTVDLLREICVMHGVTKMGKATKKKSLEVLTSLDLMALGRSTLKDDNVSSDSHLTVEEVIKDLNDIKWNECCVKSLLIVNGGASKPSQARFHKSEVSAPAPVDPKGVKRKKQKQKLLSAINLTASCTTGDESRGENSVANAGGNGKLIPQLRWIRRKRS